MSNTTLERLLHKSNVFLKNRGPTILTCIGAVGVIVTAVTAVKATPKALKKIEEASCDKGEELTKLEIVKVTAPVYIPTIVIGAATISCIFGANVLNRRQQASLSSAYALINSSFNEYKNKLKELYGEEAHNKIIDSLAVEKAKEIPIYAECLCESCDLAAGDSSCEPMLFYDEFSKRYFESTMDRVIAAEYHLNRNFAIGGCCVLNDFYEFLGLEKEDYGDEVGWAVEDELYWIDFNHRKVELDKGLECYVVEMVYSPSSDFKEYNYY